MSILNLTKAQIIYFGKNSEEIIRRQNTYAASDFLFGHRIRNFEMHWWQKFWHIRAINILENADKHIRANP